jgi:hypothetical protein
LLANSRVINTVEAQQMVRDDVKAMRRKKTR